MNSSADLSFPRPSTPAVPLATIRPLLGVHEGIAGSGDADVSLVEVTGITHDSRDVRHGDLYCALQGAHVHGADFIEQAVAAGARAVLTDARGRDRCLAAGLPTLIVDDVRSVMGVVAARVYGDPSRSMTMLGVTGTNGKTTTAYMVDAVLRADGRTTGLIGTIETLIDDTAIPSVRTTPESTDLHALLAVMLERGVTAVVMEVSSHALAMGRVDGVMFDVAGFTNLSQDHLDFHGDMESYFAAKASLFTAHRARRGVVCVDDAWGRRLAESADIPVVSVSGVGERLPMGIHGDFNRQNAAVARAMAEAIGIEEPALMRAFAGQVVVPGRLEQVVSFSGISAYVDYAHTPEAIERVLEAVTTEVQRGRVIVVLGAGGDRDAAKRPLMGAAAARLSDIVIVTDDNPRSEEPARIRESVLAGARGGGRAVVEEVGDRRSAIARGIDLVVETQGVLLVLGKGHEEGQEIGGVVRPFNDRDEVRAAWRRKQEGS